MFVNYDPEFDVIDFSVRGRADSSSLLYDDDVVANLGAEDGRDVVGVLLLSASSYLPLGKRGYDAKTDTLDDGRNYGRPQTHQRVRRVRRILGRGNRLRKANSRFP